MAARTSAGGQPGVLKEEGISSTFVRRPGLARVSTNLPYNLGQLRYDQPAPRPRRHVENLRPSRTLEVKLVGNEAAKIELGGTKNADAFDAFLRGLQLYEKMDETEAGYREALAAFDHAISLDPNFAMAFARRAGTLDLIADSVTDVSVVPSLNAQARAAAKRALALAPQLGEAHLALAFTFSRAPDFVQSAREHDLALALSPGSAWVQRNVGLFASALGHFEIAVTASRRALSLDPQNVTTRRLLAMVLINARRYGDALLVLQDARVLFPGSHDIEGLITVALLASGQNDQARKACESPSTPLDNDDRLFCLALAYHALGRPVDAQRELEQLQAIGGNALALNLAEIYAQWGNKPAALQWLSQSERQRDSGLAPLRVSWLFDPIRNEPQFRAIEARMNFPP